MKRALVVWGGMELHEPEAGAQKLGAWLGEDGFDVTVSGDVAALGDEPGQYDLICPQITGEELGRDETIALCDAIEAGTGIAAFHHGLATTFPGNARFRFLAGCTFASHPGNIIDYVVDPVETDDPIMAGIGSFAHRSEQYYLHYDPTVEVLATTTFSGEHAAWKTGVKMPVVFKSRFGKGRLFYTALGHVPAELDNPSIKAIMMRGFSWASR